MGHQPEHIASWIGDSGDVGNRTIGIVGVAQRDAVTVLKGFKSVLAALITALSMGNGQLDFLPGLPGVVHARS